MSTRTLAIAVVVLIGVLLGSLLTSLVLLRQPPLKPVPVPSVSQR